MKKLQMTRRDMIINSAWAVAGLSLTSSCSSLQQPLKSSPPKKGFKIGVCDWTIGKASTPEAFEVAKKLGLDGVQVSMGSVKDNMHLRQAQVQSQFIDAAKKHDVEIASLAIGKLNGVPYKSDARAEEWVSDSIDVCRALGINVVLLAFFGKGDLRGDKQGTDEVVRRLKCVAPKAEKAHVILGIESWLSAEEHMAIIDRIGSPAVQVYYDVANSQKAGYDIYREILFLGKNICEFHAKDYDNLYGKGSIDFKKVRKAMDAIGYRGWLQIEGIQFPLGKEDSIRYDVEYLKTIFPPKV